MGNKIYHEVIFTRNGIFTLLQIVEKKLFTCVDFKVTLINPDFFVITVILTNSRARVAQMD